MSKITIFISYAKEDEKWLNRFKPHLLSLEKDYPVEIWDDKKIKPGEDWRESIIRSLESSLVGICLVSPYFLCSDFIRNKELPVLVKGVRSEEKLLLPIILSPCRFLETKEISVYQGVNYADKPLCELSSNEQEKIFYNASTVVEQFIKIHLDKKK
jgi:hypothetical protein